MSMLNEVQEGWLKSEIDLFRKICQGKVFQKFCEELEKEKVVCAEQISNLNFSDPLSKDGAQILQGKISGLNSVLDIIEAIAEEEVKDGGE